MATYLVQSPAAKNSNACKSVIVSAASADDAKLAAKNLCRFATPNHRPMDGNDSHVARDNSWHRPAGLDEIARRKVARPHGCLPHTVRGLSNPGTGFYEDGRMRRVIDRRKLARREHLSRA